MRRSSRIIIFAMNVVAYFHTLFENDGDGLYLIYTIAELSLNQEGVHQVIHNGIIIQQCQKALPDLSGLRVRSPDGYGELTVGDKRNRIGSCTVQSRNFHVLSEFHCNTGNSLAVTTRLCSRAVKVKGVPKGEFVIRSMIFGPIHV